MQKKGCADMIEVDPCNAFLPAYVCRTPTGMYHDPSTACDKVSVNQCKITLLEVGSCRKLNHVIFSLSGVENQNSCAVQDLISP